MKKLIITILLIGLTGCSLPEPPLGSDILLIGEDQKWKDFTDNLEMIEYPNIGEKDFKGIWKPIKEEFKEIYKYVYGYDLVPWQKMDGTEMSPLQCKLKDGKEIIKLNGKCENERINKIPQWEQEWNNNVERGEFDGDALKELRKDTKPGMINSDIDETKIINRKEKKNYFAWLTNWMKSATAGVEFEDHMTESSSVFLNAHTPDTTGTGWSSLIIVIPGPGDLKIRDTNDFIDSNFGISGGRLSDTDDTMSNADYIVEIYQRNGDAGDDTSQICCRVTDATHMYCLEFNESGSDLYIINGGGWSTIDTGGGAIADGSTLELICVGTSITVEDDGSEILSATDATHTSAGKAAIGMGAVITQYDDGSSQNLDDFVVTVTAAPPAETTPTINRPDVIWFD